jgi:sigma-B regulation protein RsbQ
MSVHKRNNVHVQGHGQPMIFVHGFGCDQHMWRLVAPHVADRYRCILVDLVGSGQSELGAYDRAKYGTLAGHASDMCDVLREVGGGPAVFVGHSVSAMIGLLANLQCPELIASQVMVGPSPCYINDGAYFGGFERSDIESLLETLESNYLGWSSNMAPVIMGAPDRPQLGQELTNSFCRTDPEIAKHFARVTFLSDFRAELPKLQSPTLILQCSDDVIAPGAVGEYVHAQIPGSVLVHMAATGHCPNLSAPEETIDAIRAFL